MIPIEYDSVTLGYTRTPVVEGATFSVLEGQALALIGPNGAGKSTILTSLLGQVHVLAGSARVLGRPVGPRIPGIGYVPQHSSIDPEMPVTLRQIVMMGRYRGMKPWRWAGREDRAAVTRALELVGLAERGSARFGELSGGQRQRGLVARAIVQHPRILLMDEPFNGLDQLSRDALMATMRSLRDEGVAIVVSTHDLELARAACSHVLLVNGRQFAFGEVASTLTLHALTETFSGLGGADADRAHDLAHLHADEHADRLVAGAHSGGLDGQCD